MKKMLAMTCAALCAFAASAKTSTPKGFTDDLDAALRRRGERTQGRRRFQRQRLVRLVQGARQEDTVEGGVPQGRDEHIRARVHRQPDGQKGPFRDEQEEQPPPDGEVRREELSDRPRAGRERR